MHALKQTKKNNYSEVSQLEIARLGFLSPPGKSRANYSAWHVTKFFFSLFSLSDMPSRSRSRSRYRSRSQSRSRSRSPPRSRSRLDECRSRSRWDDSRSRSRRRHRSHSKNRHSRSGSARSRSKHRSQRQPRSPSPSSSSSSSSSDGGDQQSGKKHWELFFDLHDKRHVVRIEVEERWGTVEFFAALQGELEPYFPSASYQLFFFDNRMPCKTWNPINQTPQAFRLLYQLLPSVDVEGTAVLMIGDQARIKVLPIASSSSANRVRPARQDDALASDLRDEWKFQQGPQKTWTARCTDLMNKHPQEIKKFGQARQSVQTVCGTADSWAYLLNPLELQCPCCNKLLKMVTYPSSPALMSSWPSHTHPHQY